MGSTRSKTGKLGWVAFRMGIEVLGRSEYFRPLSTSQSLRPNEIMLKDIVENSDKLNPLRLSS